MVMMLNMGTKISEQTVKTQIRVLLMKQFDQAMHCLTSCKLMGAYVVKASCSSFKVKIIHVILVNVPLYLGLS